MIASLLPACRCLVPRSDRSGVFSTRACLVVVGARGPAAGDLTETEDRARNARGAHDHRLVVRGVKGDNNAGLVGLRVTPVELRLESLHRGVGRRVRLV